MVKIPDYDTFGYCINCGKKMVDMKVIDGISKIKLSGEYTTVMFKLNDGSEMRLAMCRGCADKWDDNESSKIHIMQKVYRGWQHEVETFSHWDEDKKKNYLEEYSKKRIVIRSDKLPSDSVERTYNKYKELKQKEDKHILKEIKHGSGY